MHYLKTKFYAATVRVESRVPTWLVVKGTFWHTPCAAATTIAIRSVKQKGKKKKKKIQNANCILPCLHLLTFRYGILRHFESPSCRHRVTCTRVGIYCNFVSLIFIILRLNK